MKPGRELDALIAEKVFEGYILDYNNYGNFLVAFKTDSEGIAIWEDLPNYSTDISAAWQVVEKLKDTLDGNKWTGEFNLFYNGQDYECWWSFSRQTEDGLYETSKEAGVADTAPLAICLASLKAVECST